MELSFHENSVFFIWFILDVKQSESAALPVHQLHMEYNTEVDPESLTGEASLLVYVKVVIYLHFLQNKHMS